MYTDKNEIKTFSLQKLEFVHFSWVSMIYAARQPDYSDENCLWNSRGGKLMVINSWCVFMCRSNVNDKLKWSQLNSQEI